MKKNKENDLFQQALELHKKGEGNKAQIKYEEILEINPLNYDALERFCQYGVENNDWAKVKDILSKAINLDYSNPFLYNNLGNILLELKQFKEAIINYETAIKLKPDFAEAYSNIGNALKETKIFNKALSNYEMAIFLNPKLPVAYSNRSNVLRELRQLEKALESVDQAIKLKGDHLEEAYNNRGVILYELKRFDESLVSFNNAISINPYYAEAYNNLGNVLKELQLVNDAIECYKKAIEIKNDYAEAYSNLGVLYKETKLFDEAIANFNIAIQLNPNLEYLYGFYLHSKMQICDWINYKENINQLLTFVGEEKVCSDSFPILALVDLPLIHKKIAEISINNRYPINLAFNDKSSKKNSKKIKLGYYSSDFNEHPLSYLIAELFELHDKNDFEIVAFYSGLAENSHIQKRLTSAFSKFINVTNLSDENVVQLSRKMGIDIAIDLTGSTRNGRLGVFAYRAAAIQVNYLGFPGTLGAEYYDYIIADKIIIPTSSEVFYTEKIIYLPKSYQVNDRKREISNKIFSKEELGLPKDGFIFCCFNNNFKISPDTFDGWVRILKSVEGSVLWLLKDNINSAFNLSKEATSRGLNPSRLIFAERMLHDEHLSRHGIADLFLDTFPYNAHTTASDALWAGLPVLTCMGESFASRVAASLLNAIELPELITSSQEEYEAKAIELAAKPEMLKVIKEKLRRNKLTTALFNTPQFTKSIETAYKEIYKRYQSNIRPENIYVNN